MNSSQRLMTTTAIPAALVTALWGWPAVIAFVLGILWLTLVAFAADGLS